MTKPHTIKFLPKAAKIYESLRKNKQTISKIQSLLGSISEKYDEEIGKPERLKGFGDRVERLQNCCGNGREHDNDSPFHAAFKEARWDWVKL